MIRHLFTHLGTQHQGLVLGNRNYIYLGYQRSQQLHLFKSESAGSTVKLTRKEYNDFLTYSLTDLDIAGMRRFGLEIPQFRKGTSRQEVAYQLMVAKIRYQDMFQEVA